MNWLWIALAAAAVAASGKNQNQKHQWEHLPSFNGVCEVQSALPGRLRLRMPSVSNHPDTAAEMKKQLESTGAVTYVECNSITGSVLVRYDPKQVEAAVVEGAVIKLMNCDQAIRTQGPSRMEEGMKTLYHAVDQNLRDLTGGFADLRMVAGSAMVIAALRQGITGGFGLPGAVTLLWWASGLFGRGMGHE